MPLQLEGLKTSAAEFAKQMSEVEIPSLFGVTDGKAVGTFIEHEFNSFIAKTYIHTAGNSAKGIDFPELNVDLKVTSVKQPQSSSPFRDASQKIYGLGYHLLIMVYDKLDDHQNKTSKLQFLNVIFIDLKNTSDYQITRGLKHIISDQGTVEEIDGYLEDKNLPLDPSSRLALAARILSDPPGLGGLTISNALQWRLQYGRAITLSKDESIEGISDLIG